MFGSGCGNWSGGSSARGRGNAWGFDSGSFWGSGPGRGRGNPFRGGRLFDQGDLKYVILQLLEEKPRHGYDIIKAIEERSGGAYAPSPGAVYPTLTLLEDLGYARVNPEEGGRKVYEITDEGRAYLTANKPVVDDIFARIAEVAQNIFGEPMMEVHKAFKDVGRAIYVRDGHTARTADQIKQVREILERAAREIAAL